jgi:tetratricopeptide (TPR) repeat protein
VGRLYVVSELYPKALETLEQALRYVGRTKDARVAGVYEKLALSNRKLRRWNEAGKRYSNAVEIWRQLPGDHSAEVRANLEAHAAMVRDLGREEEADRILEAAEAAPKAS